ncbi:single-stranded DNA-binding protein [Salinimicrobium sp. MT39]|uniref:Single-stranded DNA-binding protein n=1 Tax=Salinimicrobium profundisediminis TaxID=2994553 RepID=A0A9X3CWT9_9FLAO|nr:single-stranded DNA-binding protein [Salinimicrobium profundisediminis]MCX2836874.1 single-stranded DNA-binding protein [Salinimicrobium profundisediminis]
MNTLKNNVQLSGNVGKTPEIITLSTGRKLAKFSLATRETYTNHKGEKVTDTQWHNIVAWGKMAEMVEQQVPKGREIELEGKLNSRSYEDKNGIKKYVTEVVCRELILPEK